MIHNSHAAHGHITATPRHAATTASPFPHPFESIFIPNAALLRGVVHPSPQQRQMWFHFQALAFAMILRFAR